MSQAYTLGMVGHLPQGASQDPLLLAALEGVVYRPVPAWLGAFSFWWRGKLAFHADDKPRGLPDLIWSEALRLATLVPQVKFNALFVQRYQPGQNVEAHRDPRNNLDATVIGLYGNFGHTTLWVEGTGTAVQRPGDVFVLPCTIAGKQGPRHRMDWPEGPWPGARYAIILNRIE